MGSDLSPQFVLALVMDLYSRSRSRRRHSRQARSRSHRSSRHRQHRSPQQRFRHRTRSPEDISPRDQHHLRFLHIGVVLNPILTRKQSTVLPSQNMWRVPNGQGSWAWQAARLKTFVRMSCSWGLVRTGACAFWRMGDSWPWRHFVLGLMQFCGPM